ncbi:hypothetical protein [Sphingomonas sp. KR3-1]
MFEDFREFLALIERSSSSTKTLIICVALSIALGKLDSLVQFIF